MIRPGLDLVGGTSLLYQIKEPIGGYHSPDGHTLAEDVMAALKRRVDPEGVKNYIWRPQGENRLEIQIPASAKNDQAVVARDAYVAAQKNLESFNIRPQEVIDAVEQLTGAAREARLAELARDCRRERAVQTAGAKVRRHAGRPRQAAGGSGGGGQQRLRRPEDKD